MESPGRTQGLFTSSIGLEAPRMSPGSPPSPLGRKAPATGSDDHASPLNVLIPMGGLKKSESVVPRPMMNIVGRPIIFWLLDHLTLGPLDEVWIGLPKEVDDYFGLGKQLAHEFPKLKVHLVPLIFPTSGPIETLFVMLQAMSAEALARRTISLDSTTLYFSDVLGAFRRVRPACGASFYFVQEQPEDGAEPVDVSFSYIKMAGGIITDIREKVAISSFANTGAYGFPSANVLKACCEVILDQALEAAAKQPGRTYVSNAIKLLVDGHASVGAAAASSSSTHGETGAANPQMDGEGVVSVAPVPFVGVHVPSFACVGRQDQLDDFLQHVRSGSAPLTPRRIRFCFDLDGTLVTPPRDPEDWTSVEPILKNIELVRELKAAGHHVIVQTSRAMKAHSGNVGAVMAHIGATTFQTLLDFDIPYDEIIFGKPEADVYVGQKHVSSMIDTCAEIGWATTEESGGGEGGKGLKGAVAPRDFNTVKPVDDTHVFKTGPRDIMRGEVFWYQSVPQSLVDLFPAVKSVEDGSLNNAVSIVMSKVDGVTLTQLLVSGAVTRGRLCAALRGIKRIHATPAAVVATAAAAASSTSSSEEEGSLGGEVEDWTAKLSCNYAPKVKGRFEAHRSLYASFEPDVPELPAMFDCLHAFLEDYVSAGRFMVAAYIHGDPVFSNVLLEKGAPPGVKFIDMRGALGGQLTTAGDMNYDLSKLYQSLCGYDLMLLDHWSPNDADEASRPQSNNLAVLREVFWAFVKENYGTRGDEAAHALLYRDITLLTAAHYFTIVPLHETRPRQLMYLQQSRKLLRECGML